MKIFHEVNVGYLDTAQRDWLPLGTHMATAVQARAPPAATTSVGLAQTVVGVIKKSRLSGPPAALISYLGRETGGQFACGCLKGDFKGSISYCTLYYS